MLLLFYRVIILIGRLCDATNKEMHQIACHVSVAGFTRNCRKLVTGNGLQDSVGASSSS